MTDYHEAWISRRTAKLGGTQAARAQAEAEWSRGLELLEAVKSAEPDPLKAYGRNGKAIEFEGETRTLSGWARRLGMLPTTLCKRIKRWGVERALRTPPLRYRPRCQRNSRIVQDVTGYVGTIQGSESK